MKREIQTNEIYLERTYDASIEAVWEAWTDPAKVEKWWGPRGFTLTTHSKDLRPGGHWHYTMHGPDGTDYPNYTIYHEVEEYRKLVYDHGGNETQPPLFQVTALFSEETGKTRLQLTMALASAEAAISIRQFIKAAGGNATWDRLAEFLDETERGSLSFVINRSFPASIDQLYEAWTNPAQLCQWLPPTGFTMEFLHADICTGGKSWCGMSNDNGISFDVQFDYLECRPQRVVYTQRFCDTSGQPASHPALPVFPATLLNTVDFSSEEDGMTRVTLTTTVGETTSETEMVVFLDHRGSMTIGWSSSFDALENILVR